MSYLFQNAGSNFSMQRHIKRIHKETIKSANESTSDRVNLRKNTAVKRKHIDDEAVEGLKIPRRQGKKRSNFEEIIEVPMKRKRMSQGVKRKKENEEDNQRKKIKFRDWDNIL